MPAGDLADVLVHPGGGGGLVRPVALLPPGTPSPPHQQPGRAAPLIPTSPTSPWLTNHGGLSNHGGDVWGSHDVAPFYGDEPLPPPPPSSCAKHGGWTAAAGGASACPSPNGGSGMRGGGGGGGGSGGGSPSSGGFTMEGVAIPPGSNPGRRPSLGETAIRGAARHSLAAHLGGSGLARSGSTGSVAESVASSGSASPPLDRHGLVDGREGPSTPTAFREQVERKPDEFSAELAGSLAALSPADDIGASRLWNKRGQRRKNSNNNSNTSRSDSPNSAVESGPGSRVSSRGGSLGPSRPNSNVTVPTYHGEGSNETEPANGPNGSAARGELPGGELERPPPLMSRP